MRPIAPLILLLLSLSAYSQTNSAADSNERARSVLDRAINAYGGLESLRNVQNFSARIEGTDHHRNQSRRPGQIETTPVRMDVTVDLKNNAYRFYSERGNIGTDMGKGYDVFDGKERIYVNLRERTREVRPVSPAWRLRFTALLPQFVVLFAYGQAANLKYLGRSNFNGRPHEVIAFPAPNRTEYRLYVDSKTNLVSKQETPVSDALLGDAKQETVFSSYKTVGKFAVPSEVTSTTGGAKNYIWRFSEVSFDKSLDGSEFKPEAGLATKTAAASADEPAVQKLGENIYTVRAGGYKVLFANLNDHIFVMETPVGDGVAKEAIAKIKETVPGKPIKYAAVTHHHVDHSGGARTFVAEGTTLITTKGNSGYFDQMVKSRFTNELDTLSKNPQPLKMEFVEGKRVFSDGVTTVEVHNIGPGPHTEEMLVAYLPKEKILYEADLFDELSGLRSKATIQLADWIESKKLDVVQIVPVHGNVTSIEEFRKDVDNFKGRK